MKHAASRELYAYWEAKRGTRPAPERAEIEPGAIRGILSDTFILALDRGLGRPVRLAGTRVCALFDREIKGVGLVNPAEGIAMEKQIYVVCNRVCRSQQKRALE